MLRSVVCTVAALAAGCSEFDLHPDVGSQDVALPDVAVDPERLDLGVHPLGSVVESALTVRNDGGATLTISDISPESASLAVAGTRAFSLEPGASETVAVQLTVGEIAFESALHVLSDDPDEPDLVVPVTHLVQYPDLVIEPARLDLGLVLHGASSTGTLVLRNAGTGPVRIDALAVTGTGWRLVDGGEALLEAGAQTLATVEFAPMISGEHPGLLLADSDDPDGVESAELFGWSGGPALTIDPPSWDFGASVLGTVHPRIFTMTNTGDQPLTVTAIALADAAFPLTDLPALPLVLDPGASDTFVADYLPEAVGAGAAEVVVTSDDPAGPGRVPLSGAAWLPTPDIEVTPLFYDFGPVGHTEVTAIEIANVGDGALDLVALASAALDYTLVADGVAPSVLPPGGITTFDIVFRPSSLGIVPGTVEIASNDPDEPVVVVTLTGEGVPWDGDVVNEVFDVRLQVADVAFVIDTTGSMGALLTALTSEFETIADEIAAEIPDVTFGVAEYRDYNFAGYGSGADLPFELRQQQTDDLLGALGALGALAAAGGGDTPESTMEALFQAATGNGYDQNCLGTLTAADDVPPFVPVLGDAFGGTVAGLYVPGSAGDEGGMGFRDDVTPIFVLATDADFRDPDDGDGTPGGCPFDAGEGDVVAAVAALGGRVITVRVGMALPAAEMVSLSTATGAVGDIDGDGTDEPLAFGWNGTNAAFRDTVVASVLSLAQFGGTFGEVHLAVFSDPLGLVTLVAPDTYIDVSIENLAFDLTIRGTVVPLPDASTQPVVLHLVGDGVVLESRTLHVIP